MNDGTESDHKSHKIQKICNFGKNNIKNYRVFCKKSALFSVRAHKKPNKIAF